MEIFRTSRFVSFKKESYLLDLPINELYQNSENVFLKYVKSILNYHVYTATIEVKPEDSIISIDEKVSGVGKVSNILLTGGPHKIHVHKDGFQDFDDIIIILKDGFQKSIILKNLSYKNCIKVLSKPERADVYLNENYAGKTPILLEVDSNSDVITIIKKDYLDKTIYPSQYMNKDELNIQLKIAPELNRIKLAGESFRKRSKLLYYSGIGFLATTIIFATESTIYKQKAELYRGVDLVKYNYARDKKNLYGALATVAAFSSSVVFTFSFNDILKYFKKYETGD